MNARRPAPLRGIRVLDLTSVVLGPYCTQILADLGADVVKIEGPEGDTTRNVGPARERGMTGTFLNLNRNKRGVCLDLKRPEAVQALLRLVRGADVFMHSMRPQAVAKLGIGWTVLRAANPRLVYCNAWGFGSSGPYAEKAAYDDIIQAAAGLVDLTEMATGRASYAPTVVGDKVTGLTLLYAALAALLERAVTGRGQEVEVPMFETLASFVLAEHMSGAVFEPPLSPPVYGRQVSRERRPFDTADGRLSVIVYTDKQWLAFGEIVGEPGVLSLPRFGTLAERNANIDAVNRWLAERLRTRTTDEWLRLLDAAGVPAMKVLATADLAGDPHLQAVGFFETREDATLGRLHYPGSPARFDGAAPTVRSRAPRLGEHNREVLAEAGFSAAEIDALVACRALVQEAA